MRCGTLMFLYSIKMKLILLILFFGMNLFSGIPPGFSDLKLYGLKGKVKSIVSITYEGNKADFILEDTSKWVSKEFIEYDIDGFIREKKEVQKWTNSNYEILTKYIRNDSGTVSTTYRDSKILNVAKRYWLSDSSFEVVQNNAEGMLQIYMFQVTDKNFLLKSGELKYYSSSDSVTYQEKFEVTQNEDAKGDKTLSSVFPRTNNKLVMRDFKKFDKTGNPTEIHLMQNGLRLGFRKTFSTYTYYR